MRPAFRPCCPARAPKQARTRATPHKLSSCFLVTQNRTRIGMSLRRSGPNGADGIWRSCRTNRRSMRSGSDGRPVSARGPRLWNLVGAAVRTRAAPAKDANNVRVVRLITVQKRGRAGLIATGTRDQLLPIAGSPAGPYNWYDRYGYDRQTYRRAVRRGLARSPEIRSESWS